jgi:hypothetical protein
VSRKRELESKYDQEIFEFEKDGETDKNLTMKLGARNSKENFLKKVSASKITDDLVSLKTAISKATERSRRNSLNSTNLSIAGP